MDDKREIIDTHFHIWDGDVLTIPTLELFKGQLKWKYTLDDYQKAIEGLNVKGSIYTEVDAIREQHKVEAEMIIKLCHDDSNHVCGATIGGDLSSEGFKEYILPFAEESVVKSVRHNFFSADPSVSQDAIFRENVQLLGKLDLMCDLIMPAEKMMIGVELVKACPDTRFVIDHCGACPILSDHETRELWKDGILEYANQPNTICKVSDCGFTSPDYSWKVPDVVEIIHHCISSFGEDRIVYGTNWPVCEITGTIRRWLDALHQALLDFPSRYSDKLFFENAKRFFKCDKPIK